MRAGPCALLSFPPGLRPSPLQPGVTQMTSGYRGTEDVRRVMELAEREARRLYHEYIGTEHILLGLIREGNAATRIMTALGLDLDRIRHQVEVIILRGPNRSRRPR